MPTGPAAARSDGLVRDGTKHRRTNSRQSKTASTASHPAVKQSSPGSLVGISRLREVTGQLHREDSGSEREEELRWKINQLEKDNLDITSKYNQEVSGYEAQLARLRALLERGEAHRQTLEYEVALAKRDAAAQKTSSEVKLAELLKHNKQLKALSAEQSQRVSDLERALEITKQTREEDQQSHHVELQERDHLLLNSNAENDLLQGEKSRLEKLLQKQNDTLQELKVKLDRVQRDREKDTEELKVKKSELKRSAAREECLRKEAESAMQRIKTVEENVESERASHLESKFNSEIIQLRLRDLKAALCVEKASQAEAMSNLELLRQKFGEVEKAYTTERNRAKDAHHKFQQLEKEYLSTKRDLICKLDKEKVSSAELLDQEKAESAKLSLRLQEQERIHTENLHTLKLVQNKLVCVEEAHKDLMKGMQQLLQHYCHLGAPQVYDTGEGENRSPSALMDILKRTLHHYHTELKDLLKVVETLTKENKEKDIIITEQRNNMQECETQCTRLGEEVERLRIRFSDAEAAAEHVQMELHSIRQSWEEEKERHTHTRAQMNTLTQEHKKDQQEKLAFLHSLYQQLVAGCVLVAPPQSMLGRFSWAELSAVLQEHVVTLTSDLCSANQRISGLETVCEGKMAALASVCEQLKQREESWITQRRELDTHHTQITNELQTRLQDLRRQLEKSEDSARVSAHTCSDLEQEVTRLQDLLSVCRRDDSSLLAACALLAGCLRELYSRVCALSHQKTLLWDRVCDGESLEREVGALLHALSDHGQTLGKAQAKVRGGVWVFRKCVIAVLAILRLQKLRRNSHTLFRVTGGYRESPSVCVREVALKEGSQWRQGKEEEDERNISVMKMLTSSELAVLIHSCMQGVHQELDKSEHSSGLLKAAQLSFSKLLERLLSETDSGSWGCYENVGSLAQRLGHGLQKLRTKHCTPPKPCTSQGMVSSLQQHFLVFTQRLHSTEVERRELRLELSRLKRSAAHARKILKDNAHTACVPVDQFQSVCTELNLALQREQQAQALLHQQATQLQELGLTMELHTGDQLEKDRTLAQAVQSLSEAKTDLKRKELSLRVLGKQLSQAQLEKQQLQQSITSAEHALCSAAKSKDSLSSYTKAVECSLKELKDRIVLSRSSTSRENFSLHLPSIHLDVPGPELNMGGVEIAACQALVESFIEVYQLACSKIASLEREISSYQSHITMLKAELQDACLRENQIYVPVIGSDNHLVPLFEAEVDTGTPQLSDVGVTRKDVPGNVHPHTLLALKKSKAVKKVSKNSKSHRGALKT